MTNPTPSPEMPKPDFTWAHTDQCVGWYEDDDGTTAIERHAASLQTQLDEANARAERAEKSYARIVSWMNRWRQRYHDKSAECERLRSLLDAIPRELREWWSFDSHQFHTHSYHSREDYIEWLGKRINAALTTDSTKENDDE